MPQDQNRPPRTKCRNCEHAANCHRCGADPNADPLPPAGPWQCVCSLLLGIIFILFIIPLFSTPILISVFLCTRSGYPKPAPPVFAITSLVLHNNTLNLRFNVSNPNNQVAVYYNGAVFSAYYRRDVHLGDASVGKFSQVGPSVTELDVSFPYLDPAVVGPAGFLNLKVNGTANVVFRDGVRKMRGKYGGVTVRCDNVGVLVAAHGSEMVGNGGGDMMDCRVTCDECRLVPLWMDRIF